jgi:hypothetical protein
VLKVFFTSVKNTFNTVSYKEQFLIKLASTKNVTFNVSCIKTCLQNFIEKLFQGVALLMSLKLNFYLSCHKLTKLASNQVE